MTAQEVFYSALALMGETETAEADYDEDMVVRNINILLGEAHNTINAVRRFNGEDDITVQRLTMLNDEILADDKIVQTALPFGLASRLFYMDDEISKASYYNAQFYNSLKDFEKTRIERIKDVM